MPNQALKLLYEKYSDNIFIYLARLGSSDELAYDLLHDTFLKAHIALKKKTNVTNEKAWLYRIAHNVFIDHCRTQSPELELLENVEVANPVDFTNEVEWQALRENIIKRLSQEDSDLDQLFILRLDHDMTHRQISEVLQRSFRTVRRQFEKIRAILQQEFKELDIKE